jgi:hypothetical protein
MEKANDNLRYDIIVVLEAHAKAGRVNADVAMRTLQQMPRYHQYRDRFIDNIISKILNEEGPRQVYLEHALTKEYGHADPVPNFSRKLAEYYNSLDSPKDQLELIKKINGFRIKPEKDVQETNRKSHNADLRKGRIVLAIHDSYLAAQAEDQEGIIKDIDAHFESALGQNFDDFLTNIFTSEPEAAAPDIQKLSRYFLSLESAADRLKVMKRIEDLPRDHLSQTYSTDFLRNINNSKKPFLKHILYMDALKAETGNR